MSPLMTVGKRLVNCAVCVLVLVHTSACVAMRVAQNLTLPDAEWVSVPSYRIAPQTWKPNHFVAGVSRVDITPPVGYPTGGHGPTGGFARAYWTRLYARAF